MVIIATAAIVKAGDKFLTEKEADKRCPSDMVAVSNPGGEFCIDKYENSAGDKCFFAAPNNQDETAKNLNEMNCRPVSESGNVPWTNISLDQAQFACAKAGKRLASHQEWFEAALGTPDGGSPTRDDCQISKNWEKQPGSTGSGKNCVSGSGAYDMVGNVWEWVSGLAKDGKIGDHDLPKEGYIRSTNGQGLPLETGDKPDEIYFKDYFWVKNQGTRAIARGGYWDNGQDGGQYSLYVVLQPNTVGQGIGFRCAK